MTAIQQRQQRRKSGKTRPAGLLDRPEEIEGACLETLLYQEIIALNEYANLGYEIFFWRTATGAEVDFVLYGGRGMIAIEVKRTRRASRTDLSGLSLFHSDYPEARCILLSGGERREYRNGLEVIPLEEGIKELGTIMASPARPADG